MRRKLQASSSPQPGQAKNTPTLPMELMERAIVSRRDRLALAVRRQRQQPRQEFNNGSIQPANNLNEHPY